jgi:hypothetical protein
MAKRLSSSKEPSPSKAAKTMESSSAMTSTKFIDVLRPWVHQSWVKVPHPDYPGIVYYYNEDTDASVWDRPEGAPE